MLQYPYRFNIYIFIFANEIRPYKSHAYHRHKSCDALHVAHVGLLDVESGGLHGLEGSLDLPAFLIGQDSTFWTVEAYENLQFRDSVGVFLSGYRQDIHTALCEGRVCSRTSPARP